MAPDGNRRRRRRGSLAPVTYALHPFERSRAPLGSILQMGPAMQILKLLPLAIVAGCTSTASDTTGPPRGSDAWFETASEQDITNYLRERCVSYGYMPATRAIAECIEGEARAHKQMNVARRAALAGGTVED